ncbi:MAG: hypothetical protein AB1451_00780 [Nitrospirota bacterium]
MTETLLHGVAQTLDTAMKMALDLFPKILGMLIIIAVGWVIAIVVKILVRHFLKLVKFDVLCDNVGATQMFTKADLPPPTELLSSLVFWVTLAGFLMLGISTLGIIVLQEQISRFFLYVPQIFIALIILFIGILFANFAARAVLLGMVNANVPSARLLSNTVRVFLVILTVAMALEQVALAKTVVLIAFSIAFGAVMLGLAIAFGIGGRDVARRFLERQFAEDSKPEKDEISHL